MKFTTDIERYYFACAKRLHAETMEIFCRERAKACKRNSNIEYHKKQEYEYVKQYNYWTKVINYFGKKIGLDEFKNTMFYGEGVLLAR